MNNFSKDDVFVFPDVNKLKKDLKVELAKKKELKKML